MTSPHRARCPWTRGRGSWRALRSPACEHREVVPGVEGSDSREAEIPEPAELELERREDVDLRTLQGAREVVVADPALADLLDPGLPVERLHGGVVGSHVGGVDGEAAGE